MKSLPEITRDNEDAVLAAIDDESRPIVERTRMWQTHEDNDPIRKNALIDQLVEYAETLESQLACIRAANPLVAVPDGEATKIDNLDGDWFIYKGDLYRHVTENKGINCNFGIALNRKDKAIHDYTLVQPVRLVRFDKWGKDHED